MYDRNTHLFDTTRPDFCKRGNMDDPVFMLHHRISWHLIVGGVLNPLIKGRPSKGKQNVVINLLEPIYNLIEHHPNRTFLPQKKEVHSAINFLSAYYHNHGYKSDGMNIEQATIIIDDFAMELFSLPCNLFLGPKDRADDPGEKLDFTPRDIRADGSYSYGKQHAYGDRQRCIEKVVGYLRKIEALYVGTSPNISQALYITELTNACKEWQDKIEKTIDVQKTDGLWTLVGEKSRPIRDQIGDIFYDAYHSIIKFLMLFGFAAVKF